METSYDIINAKMYAENCALEYQYNKFLQSHPHIFRHCEINSRQATNDDYYIPPAIANQCKVVNIKFNETGCKKVACFPKKDNLQNCTNADNTTVISLGNQYTFACQPACSQISLDIDTEYRKGKCLM
ncbi:baculo_p74_N domain-containing protein, partial [Nephila pilipes]